MLEGVSNTTNIFDKVIATRVRPHPRAFYGSGRVLKVYNAEDALAAAMVKRINPRVRVGMRFVV